MEEYQVNVYVPVTKDYKVNRLTIRNVKYTGDYDFVDAKGLNLVTKK